MARELYNWDQVIAYSIIALNNLKTKNKDVNFRNFITELNPLQTLYGKDGVVGLAHRYLKKEKDKEEK